MHHFFDVDGMGDDGFGPNKYRTDVDCAGCDGSIGGCGLEYDGSRQVSGSLPGAVSVFCLPGCTWQAPLAVNSR